MRSGTVTCGRVRYCFGVEHLAPIRPAPSRWATLAAWAAAIALFAACTWAPGAVARAGGIVLGLMVPAAAAWLVDVRSVRPLAAPGLAAAPIATLIGALAGGGELAAAALTGSAGGGAVGLAGA